MSSRSNQNNIITSLLAQEPVCLFRISFRFLATFNFNLSPFILQRTFGSVPDDLLGDPEVTGNLYCNFVYLYWEGCVICSNFWVTQYVQISYPICFKTGKLTGLEIQICWCRSLLLIYMATTPLGYKYIYRPLSLAKLIKISFSVRAKGRVNAPGEERATEITRE